jgi:hypothetical protein
MITLRLVETQLALSAGIRKIGFVAKRASFLVLLLTALALTWGCAGTASSSSHASTQPPPPTTHSATLSWTASTSTVSGYNVYRGSVSGGPYTLVNTSLVTLLTFTDSAVQSGQTYFYVTTAVDGSGNESLYSNETTAAIP